LLKCVVGDLAWRSANRKEMASSTRRTAKLKETSMATCSDLMTKNPICCLSTDSASHAAQLMKHEEVGLLPVVQDQDDQRVIGVVTDRDLVVHVVANGLRPDDTVVADVMTAILSCATPTTVSSKGWRRWRNTRCGESPSSITWAGSLGSSRRRTSRFTSMIRPQYPRSCERFRNRRPCIRAWRSRNSHAASMQRPPMHLQSRSGRGAER
jgi:hypothetical protein